MWESLYKAIFQDWSQSAPEREVARHLSRVALFGYEKKDMASLYPDVETKAFLLIQEMQKQKMPIYIVENFRSAKKQNEYFSKGRTIPGSVITNAKGGESYHQYGLAFDVAFEKYNWTPPSPDWWALLGKEGEKLGLVWGGSFRDYGHFEWHPGFTWEKLKSYFRL